MDDGDGVGIDEHTLVDVLAGPDGSLVEGLVVLSVVEGLEESDGLFEVLRVEDGEDLTLGQEVVLVHVPELLRVLGLGPLAPHAFPFEGIGDLYEVLVVAGLVDVVEQAEDILLFFQEYLITCKTQLKNI